ncbi:hypothetical protein JCM10450v2_006703 [Rhodotorula kratochvilovae]
MVSFSCEVCNDTIKKPKLDQHAGRCRGAYFTCCVSLASPLPALTLTPSPRAGIDCNTTFEGTSYRAHTSCVSEEQRYHKSVYKAPKGKGKKAQQQNENAPPAAPAPAPAPAPAAVEAPKEEQKKRAREDEAPAPAKEAAPALAVAAAVAAGEPKTDGADEPAKKKKKKSKKAKGEAAETNGAGEPAAAAPQENGAPSVKGFLVEAVTPLLAGGDVSLAEVRAKVVEQAKAKGLKVDEVESALWAGLKVGGKKQKVRAEFA